MTPIRRRVPGVSRIDGLSPVVAAILHYAFSAAAVANSSRLIRDR
jgi:hypothetical protein